MSDRWQEGQVPSSDAELFDYLRWRHGIGFWAEDDPQFPPYWKWRMAEIGILKRVRTARRASFQEVYLASEFCHRHRLPVYTASWLFKHIAVAKKEAAQKAVPDLQRQIDEAIACERTLADSVSSSWIVQLTRARGPYREEVLREWQQARQSKMANTLHA